MGEYWDEEVLGLLRAVWKAESGSGKGENEGGRKPKKPGKKGGSRKKAK